MRKNEARKAEKSRQFSPLFKLALVLVRFDHVASFILNANHGIMRATAMLGAERWRFVVRTLRAPNFAKESVEVAANDFFNSAVRMAPLGEQIR